MPDPTESPQQTSLRWPSLTFALALIVAALSFTRPWERLANSPYGIVRQVQPSSAVELETGTSVGQLAPNFLLTTADGQTLQLSDLRGTPVFVNFWATWCIFCVSEMPAIQRLADRYEGQLTVIGINVGQAASDAQRFAQQTAIRYPLLLDTETAVAKAYNVQAMPTSLVVDADGVVQHVHYGVLTPPQMQEIIQPLLLNSRGELARRER